jgi:hypothetical protein
MESILIDTDILIDFANNDIIAQELLVQLVVLAKLVSREQSLFISFHAMKPHQIVREFAHDHPDTMFRDVDFGVNPRRRIRPRCEFRA